LSNHADYAFAGIYADEGISGTSVKNRDGFRQMINDCRNGKLDMVITKSVSRFGRNTVDCLNAVRELKALNIDVFFEKENIHTSHSEGELLLTLMMAVAEAESFSISENVKWGMRKRAEQGKTSVMSTPPYGYDRNAGGLLTINEKEASVVRRMFRDFLDGYGYSDIVSRLNTEGIPTRNNRGAWALTSIMQMLSNEKLKGDSCYQKSFVLDPLTKKKKMNRGELPRYYMAETHPYIIEPEMWDCVQLEMQRRSDYAKSHHTRLATFGDADPLTGKVICGDCGYSFGTREHSPYLFCTAYEKLHHSSARENLRCHHIKLERLAPERAFVRAWNALVEGHDSYAREWSETLEYGDVLQRLRVKELMCLVKEIGEIETLSKGLCFKAMDHIEVGLDLSMTVVFLAGTQYIYNR